MPQVTPKGKAHWYQKVGILKPLYFPLNNFTTFRMGKNDIIPIFSQSTPTLLFGLIFSSVRNIKVHSHTRMFCVCACVRYKYI